uniref:CCHC-type domain-containing protein n=1 Tax=Fagus sylvatica TaxID=28930 RepID=A0A2N9EBH3_FAGSY
MSSSLCSSFRIVAPQWRHKNVCLLLFLHSKRNITFIPSVMSMMSSSTSDDSVPIPKQSQLRFDPSVELFGLDVAPKPRNDSSGAPNPGSWFGPNGQYIRELPCPSCRGRGYTPCTECGIERSRLDCLQCNGKGIMRCRQCLGDCVIWEESIDERPWEKARSTSPLKVKEDDEVDNLDIKLGMKKKSKRVYQSPRPEVGLKISRSLKSLNAKTGLFSKRMRIIHRDPTLHAQRVAAIKKAKGTAAARRRASEVLKAYFSDPENRRKRSISMKGVKFYCRNCGREGHRRHYCPELKESLIAMALQTGMGLSRILILVGAGYTSTIMIKNGKFSDLLGEIQSLMKGLEKSRDQAEGDDVSDAIAAQVRRLAMEVRQLANTRQITVLNGSNGQIGNVTSLLVPAATLGALGYGYMWWKGLSFSDLMYVTKRNMASAVTNLTKHLENVSEALAATKRHLTQRIANLDDKMEKQNEMSKLIKNDVAEVQKSLSDIGYDLNDLQRLVAGLDGKIGTLEDKQDIANLGVLYLCNFVDGKKGIMPEVLKEQLKLSGKPRSLLTYQETPSLKGLKEIADSLSGTGIIDRSASDGIVQEGVDRLEEPPRTLLRFEFNFSSESAYF